METIFQTSAERDDTLKNSIDKMIVIQSGMVNAAYQILNEDGNAQTIAAMATILKDLTKTTDNIINIYTNIRGKNIF